jgi:hypothetical protein
VGTAAVTTLTATQASVSSINAAVALVTTGTVTTLSSTQASISSANVAALRFIGASSGYVGFIAATSAGSITYTWPNTAGINGYVLASDGTGSLAWVAQSGGGGGGGSNAFAWFIS